MKIEIDSGLSSYIEGLQYEKNRTNEIMAFMLSYDYDITTENFKKWDKENQTSYVKYEQAKKLLEDTYIRSISEFVDKKVSWTLDFETNTLDVEVLMNAE